MKKLITTLCIFFFVFGCTTTTRVVVPAQSHFEFTCKGDSKICDERLKKFEESIPPPAQPTVVEETDAWYKQPLFWLIAGIAVSAGTAAAICGSGHCGSPSDQPMDITVTIPSQQR